MRNRTAVRPSKANERLPANHATVREEQVDRERGSRGPPKGRPWGARWSLTKRCGPQPLWKGGEAQRQRPGGTKRRVEPHPHSSLGEREAATAPKRRQAPLDREEQRKNRGNRPERKPSSRERRTP